ncbi:MAG: AtpZ/AtpI family protein [bacterium]|jgi:ATP synthase protein I
MKFPQLNPKFIAFSSMGLELGLSVIVGFLLGSWLDRYFGTEPWLLLIFGISGIIAGYRSVFRLLKKVQQEPLEEQSS